MIEPGMVWARYVVGPTMPSMPQEKHHIAGDPARARNVVIRRPEGLGVDAALRYGERARVFRGIQSASLIDVYEVTIDGDDVPVIVVQHGDRGTLAPRIGSASGSGRDLDRLSRALGAGLDALHASGLHHGAVSPPMVQLLAGPPQPPIAPTLFFEDDAIRLGYSSGLEVATAETLAYFAPEQRKAAANGAMPVAAATVASDIWSASATVAAAAAGRAPAAGETWRDVLDDISTTRPALSTALARGLDENPALRHSNIRSWHSDVSSALVQREPIARNRRWKRLALAALALVVLAGVAAAAVWWPDRMSGDDDETQPPLVPTSTPAVATATPPSPTPTDVPPTAVPPTAVPEAPADTADVGPTSECIDNPDGAVGGFVATAVTDSTISVEWEPVGAFADIFLDGAYLDALAPGSARYVIEGLEPGTDHEVVIDRDNPATACARTREADDEGGEILGALRPGSVGVAEAGPSSLTIEWEPPAEGEEPDAYTVVVDGRRLTADPSDPADQRPLVGGDITQFTIDDLDPNTDVVIGVRSYVGNNRSAVTSAVVRTAAAVDPADDGGEDASDDDANDEDANDDDPSDGGADSDSGPDSAPGGSMSPEGAAPAAQPPVEDQAPRAETGRSPIVAPVWDVPMWCGPAGEGPVPNARVVDATESTLTIEWPARNEPLDIFVNDQYHDFIRAGASRFVVENLSRGDQAEIIIARPGERDAGSTLCGTTLSIDDGSAPLGVPGAENLRVINVQGNSKGKSGPGSEISVTIGWDSPIDRATFSVYLGPEASGSRRPAVEIIRRSIDGTAFLFTDLEIGRSYVAAVRVESGPNRSNFTYLEFTAEKPH